MARYTEITTQAGDQIIDVLQRVEKASVEAVATISQAANGVLDKLPSVPFTNKLPTAGEVAQANYALVERLLQEQKSFTLRLIDSSAPVVPVQSSATSKSAKAGSSK